MTVIYDVPFTGASSGNLNSGARVRYGVVFEAASALLTKQIKTWTIQIKKTAGATGTVDAAIYDSGSTLISTAVESFDASILATTYGTNYTWTFTSPRTIASGDHLVIRYSGVTIISVRIHNTDQYDAGNTRRTSWDGVSWISSSTDEIDGSISDGIFERQLPTEIIDVTESLNRLVTNSRTLTAETVASTETITRLYAATRPIATQTITISENLSTLYTAGGGPIEPTPPPSLSVSGGPAGRRRRQAAFRNYIKSLAHDLKSLFRIKQREPPPPEPEETPIPEPQPPEQVTILSGPPTSTTPLPTLNDKWSMVASTIVQAAPEPRTEVVYPPPPFIPQPEQNPLIQSRVTIPPAPLKQSAIVSPYRVGEGRHIESQFIGLKKPKNVSKTASTLTKLLILLEIESRI